MSLSEKIQTAITSATTDVNTGKDKKIQFVPFDIKKDNVDININNVESVKYVDCTVYVSCDIANKIKNTLMHQINLANDSYNEDISHLSNLESVLKTIPAHIIKSVVKPDWLKITTKLLQDKRTKDRGNIKNVEYPCKIYLKGYNIPKDATISKLNPGMNSLTISYVGTKDNRKTFEVKFDKLCIGTANATETGPCDIEQSKQLLK